MDTLLLWTCHVWIPSLGRRLLCPLEASFLKGPLIFRYRISFITGSNQVGRDLDKLLVRR
jgi:hypothetical protein